MTATDIVARLKDVLGPQGVLEGDEIGERYRTDLFGTRRGDPLAVIRPASTDQVSKALAICHEQRQPVVTQGGMTGLVDGAVPVTGEIALSLERMREIVEFDPVASTLTVQAGITLQAVQEFADRNDFFFPLDIGARGSCTIGGNLATNAGGNRVIRYGMMRDLTLGLEVVLADGEQIDSRVKTIKNNTGYDLRQLFIGSEGTLGVITSAVLRLHAKPRSQCVAFCGLESFSDVTDLLHHLRGRLSGTLSAFEVIWHNAYRAVIDHVPAVHPPLPPHHSYYVLLESMGGDSDNDGDYFNKVLEDALAQKLIRDAVVAQSKAAVEKIWAVRDGIPEALLALRPVINYDISIPLADMDDMARRVNATLDARFPNHITLDFGHIGDGNLHISTTVGDDTKARQGDIDEIVYGLTARLAGSISAEHGIGLTRRAHLGKSRSSQEISLMRSLKQALDPLNILNPARVLDMEG